MTATDELRRLLDERGVEWGAEESELDHVTTWNANGGQAMFYESKTTNPNLLQVNYYDLTPEQAVEATLGMGTCRVVRKPVSYSDDWKESLEAAGVVEVYTPTCSECGAYIEPPSEFTAGWNYCPNCGRRIEVDA